jgi:hypothetical protein
MAAKTLTQAEAITEVSTYRLDDSANARFTAAMVRTWINDGMVDIARRTECLRASSTISVTADVATVTGPVDCIRIHRAEYYPTGSDLRYPLEYRDFNQMDVLWGVNQNISTAIPAYYTTWGFPPTLTIRLAPVPAVAGSLLVYYYRLPAELATANTNDASTVLDLPTGWHDLVLDYVEAMAYRADRRPDRYQEAWARYLENLQAMVAATERFTDAPTYMVPDGGQWGAGWDGDWY